MRTNVFAASMLLVGALGVATLGAAPTRQMAIVRFLKPTIIAGVFVQGTVVIEHDDARMARGEPCTTVYRFKSEKQRGPKLVEFMCLPQARERATEFEAALVASPTWPDRLLEYKFAGDTEGHGVPDWR